MAKSERLTRVELVSDDGFSHRMNVLVEANPLLLPGNSLTLKDSDSPDTLWTILRVHETLNRVDIKHGWNNNI